MAKLTAAQRVYVARRSKPKELSPEDEGGELNIVPFLDIIVNVMIFVLGTITTVFTASIPTPVPRAGGGGGGATNEVNITVQIVETGYVVAANNGFLQPGCTTVGSFAMTLPLVNGRHDTEGLTRCMVTVRNNPQWRDELRERRNIQISVNGGIPYRTLVQTLDAVRGTRPGERDLFDEPTLGILTGGT